MADNSRSAGTLLIQVLLGVVILGLGYLLYQSIREPYKEVERQKALTELTRARMDHVRVSLRSYESQNKRFPSTLDSLMTYVRAAPNVRRHLDSLSRGTANVDSMVYSPRNGQKFEYAVNDTSRVIVYYLKDPASDDVIGSRDPDITQLHAASWE